MEKNSTALPRESIYLQQLWSVKDDPQLDKYYTQLIKMEKRLLCPLNKGTYMFDIFDGYLYGIL